MKRVSLLLVLLCMSLPLFLQAQSSPWAPIDEANIPLTGQRDFQPNTFRTYRIDTAELLQLLLAAPHETEVNPLESPLLLSLPRPDGSTQTFRMVRYDMMEPALAQQYPGFGTWRGISIDKPRATLRLDWTLRGLRAMVRSQDDNYFIDPYCRGNANDVVVYFKKDFPRPNYEFSCQAAHHRPSAHEPDWDQAEKAGDCTFRTYRLAMATTGEYSNYHGAFNSGQEGLVLSEVTTAMNRVNGIYEEDVAVRMILIANTTDVFYYNPATDPYTNNNGGAMLGQNQTTLDNVIGSANYDIGHVFSTGGGGVAYLNAVCNNSIKAGGVTGLGNPIGDPFYVDYVAHEIGHQFGAGHTQYNSCQRSNASAMEPGSASTIMGYAGICNPNVQNFSDDYFHAISLQQIGNFVTGSGGSCAATPGPGNTAPVVDGGLDYSIPRSTPFVLEALATDPDGDPLTYNWEQFNNQGTAPQPPQGTNTQGPMFRTFKAVSSPERYFPNLTAVVNNSSPTWEVLPSVARTMNFRITVRDYNGTYGCTTEDNVVISSASNAGPFLVTQPNTGVTWTEGESYTVTWNVANTNINPVNSPNVDIFLSYDGGFTYPATLATNVPNNGSATVILPPGTTTQARVMVKGHNHVFFDISNVNFTIVTGVPNYALSVQPLSNTSCPSGSVSYSVEVGSFAGFSDPVSLSLSGNPAGTTASFSNNPVTPGNSSNLSISNLQNAVPGTYTLMLDATSSTGPQTLELTLVILANPGSTSLLSPPVGAIDQSLFPTLEWAPASSATSYEWQLSESPAFSPLLASGTTSMTSVQIGTELAPGTVHYWKVRALNDCADGSWSAPRTFTTVPCFVYMSADVPVVIPANQATTVFSTLDIAEFGTISDLNVVELIGTHTWVGDLVIRLESPAGTKVTTLNRVCDNGYVDDFDLNFDDQAALLYSQIPCPPTTGLTYRPFGTLADFNGQEINGTWTLEVQDVFNQDGGSLNSWGIRVCPEAFSGFLPVAWLNFEAKALPTQQAAQLRWETAMEEQNRGFEVQRRTLGEAAFQTIGWVDARPNAEGEGQYVFLDASPAIGESVYYRLRQIDYDGTADFSPVRSVFLDAEGSWSLYPNPTLGTCLLEYRGLNLSTERSLRVFDARGRMVHANRIEGSSQELNLSNLPSGTYWVEVRSESGIWRERLVLMRM